MPPFQGMKGETIDDQMIDSNSTHSSQQNPKMTMTTMATTTMTTMKSRERYHIQMVGHHANGNSFPRQHELTKEKKITKKIRQVSPDKHYADCVPGLC